MPEHAELHLLLSMVTPAVLAGAGARPTRSSSSNLQEKDLSTYGFLGYPLLQSADIIIYKADAVPVGEDQAPHVELTREVVRRFNNLYGPVFPEPKTLLTATPRVPGTDGRKMSKSYGNAVYLKDPPESRAAEDPAHGHRPRAQAAHRSRQPRHLPGVRPAQGLLHAGDPGLGGGGLPHRGHRLPGLQGRAARPPPAAPGGDPRPARRSSRPGRTRCGTSCEAGSQRAREVARATMEDVRAAMKISYSDDR